MPVIQRALFVLLRQALGRRLIRFAVKQHNTLGPVVLTGVHKHIEHIVPVLQNIIRAAAHDHAVAFFCQIQNNLALHRPQIIRRRQSVHHLRRTNGRKGVGQAALAGGILAGLLNIALGKTGFLRHMAHQLLVIIIPAQRRSNSLAHGAPAGAELSTNGNYFYRHGKAPLPGAAKLGTPHRVYIQYSTPSPKKKGDLYRKNKTA